MSAFEGKADALTQRLTKALLALRRPLAQSPNGPRMAQNTHNRHYGKLFRTRNIAVYQCLSPLPGTVTRYRAQKRCSMAPLCNLVARFGLRCGIAPRKQTFNVRFAPESRHKWLWCGMSAFDPKRKRCTMMRDHPPLWYRFEARGAYLVITSPDDRVPTQL